MTITHETMVLGAKGLPDGVTAAMILREVADHAAHVGHVYFVERHVNGGDWNELKSRMSREFGLTHRQFSSIAAIVDGKADAVRESMGLHAEGLERRIASAEKKLKGWKQKLAGELVKDTRHRVWHSKRKSRKADGKKAPAEPKSLRDFHPGDASLLRQDLRNRIHHKKRYVIALARELAALRCDIERGKVPLCFGSRKLFGAQNNLAMNGFASQEEWLSAWQERRSSQIFCIGSKDEEYGSQTAAWLGEGTLRVRLPIALEAKYGKYLLLTLKGFRREGVQDQVDYIAWRAAKREADGRLFDNTQGLSWRLVRRQDKDGETWVAQVSFDRPAVVRISDDRLGAWGLDFNPDHVAMTRVDRFGNPVDRTTFPINIKGKSQDQAAAILGDAAAWAIALCAESGVPLCAERLDFQEKKATLREKGTGYARMLSQFAYATFHELTDRRADACGVEARRVNPAFTSVIGEAKFALGYAMSVHHAAACAIARRGLRFSEHLARRETSPAEEAEENPPSRNAFPLPVRTRGKHVWSDWRRFSNVLRNARQRARTAVGAAGAATQSRRERRRGNLPWRIARDNRHVVQSHRKSAKPFRWQAFAFKANVVNDKTL